MLGDHRRRGGLLAGLQRCLSIAPRSSDDIAVPALRDLGRTDLTITDLYDNSSYAGEYVTLTGLIATTSTTSDGHYFFVQAPGGGSRSGMMVDLRGDTTDVATRFWTRSSFRIFCDGCSTIAEN